MLELNSYNSLILDIKKNILDFLFNKKNMNGLSHEMSTGMVSDRLQTRRPGTQSKIISWNIKLTPKWM